MTFGKLFFASLSILSLWNYARGQDCAWDRDLDFPLTSPPLLLDATTRIVYPVLEGTLRMVRVPLGDTITIACSGTIISLLGLEAVEGTCAGDKLINIEGVDYALSDLGCLVDVSESIQRNLGSCGDTGIGTLHSIGFDIATTGSFLEIERVCFEPVEETTLYTQHILHGANILAKDSDGSRPSFKSSTGFFTVSMNNIYTQKAQLALMEVLLGDENLANQTIIPSEQLYMARGHISADADFVTIAEQDATYYYINAMPHWQIVNNGNWKYLEFDVRDLAANHSSDFIIYSGGFEVMQLADINGDPVDIYLGLTENQTVVPAPQLTWKVIHEESSKKAAGVIAVNNPFLEATPTPICQDICSSLTWITFNTTTDLSSGYTYCCTVAELRAVIPHMPDIGVVGLLDS